MLRTLAAFSLVVGLTLSTPVAAHDTKAAPAAAADAVSPAAKVAADVVDAFHAALSRGDTGAALALLSDDAIVYEGGEAETKAQYASHHLAADAAFAAAVRSTRTRRTAQIAGDVAWIVSEGRTTGQYRERAVDSYTTETMVLRRGPSGWRIVHIHWSSRRATPA